MEEFSRDETGRGRLLVSADDHERIFFAWDRGDLDSTSMSLRPEDAAVTVPTRFLTTDTLRAMFTFGKDLLASEAVPPNRLDQPVLFRFYQKGWARFNE